MHYTLLLLMLAFSFLANAQKTYIHAGNLIDGENDQLLNQKTIVVQDGKILEIADGYLAAGEEDQVIDLKSHTVM